MKLLSMVIVLTFYSITYLYSAYLDTKMAIWRQPDGTAFTGRCWGDEFLNWNETQDGYRYVFGEGNWYYYATLDAKGEFAATIFKVGIDAPPTYAYKLERSQSRITELNEMREIYDNRLNDPTSYNSKGKINRFSIFSVQLKKIGVILVEFTDRQHYGSPAGGYQKDRFDSMMFSSNYWTGNLGNNIHPENEAIFGSLRDYYEQMSLGQFSITGNVINPPDNNGVARWIKLNHPTSYYNNAYSQTLYNDARQAAQDSGWITQTYDYYTVIYAQDVVTGGTLWPRAVKPYGIIMSERYNGGFAHIGIHCHEFGHLAFNFHDEYNPVPTPLGNFDLMALGSSNGPTNKGECPSALSPYYRIRSGWVTPITISSDVNNMTVPYNYSYPQLYKIQPVEGEYNECYIFESRGRDGFDKYTPNNYSQYQNQNGTLLVWWQRDNENLWGDRINLIEADDIEDEGSTYSGDFFPSSGYSQDFDDGTYPRPLLIYGGLGHLGLTGIHKVTGSYNTQIDNVRPNYGQVTVVSTNTTWSGMITQNRDIRIVGNATLTIQPGTILSFTKYNGIPPFKFSLVDNAQLVVIGNSGNMIQFKSSQGNKGDWYGIRQIGSSSIQMQYVELKDAVNALSSNQSNLQVDNIHFINNTTSVSLSANNVSITNCNFDNNTRALSILSEISYFQLKNSLFSNQSGPAVEIIPTSCSPIIEGCSFYSTPGPYIVISSAGNAIIKNNIFHGPGEQPAILIQGPTNCQPEIINNIFYGLTNGIVNEPRDYFAHPIVKNNIFYLNNTSINDPDGLGTYIYNNFYNKDTLSFIPPSTNIKKDPQFVNAVADNFHLLNTSPSIDAGDPADDYTSEPQPNGKRINQGNYGNTQEATKSIYITGTSTWYGSFTLDQDATVATGGKLIVDPATLVKFDYGKSLTVNGKLIAKGTSSNRIIFTSSEASPTPGDWHGIICSGGGPDTLKYVTIKNAETGISFSNTAANCSMEQDSVLDCSGTGVYVSNTQTSSMALQLYKTNIAHNLSKGLKANNAKVGMYYSRIHGNGTSTIGSGVEITNAAKVYFDSSRVDSNLGTGIYTSGSGSFASLSRNGTNRGYNTITEHGVSEIIVTNSSSAFLGNTVNIFDFCDCGGEDQSLAPGDFNSTYSGVQCTAPCVPVYHQQINGGWNNVFNSASYNCRLIYNTTSGTVRAQYTYWGSGSTMFCGSIDSTHQLGAAISTPAKTIITTGEKSISGNGNDRSDILKWLRHVRNNIASGEITDVASLYQLADYSGPGGGYTDALDKPWDTYLSQLETTTRLSKNIREASTALRLQSRLDQGYLYDVITLANTVLKQTSTSNDLWLFSQTRKIFALAGMGNLNEARKLLEGIEDRAMQIDTNAFRAMEQYLMIAPSCGVAMSTPQQGSEYASEAVPEIPQKTKLLQNFPNPFNPTTTIQYQLHEDSYVTLKLYDILGREVQVLVCRMESAGYKSVTFDASGLPSGVYYYRLQAGTFSDVKKMILVR